METKKLNLEELQNVEAGSCLSWLPLIIILEDAYAALITSRMRFGIYCNF